MSCPHSETTTLLWIFGEGPEGHEAHVANCPECSAVLEMHESVQFQVAEMEQPIQRLAVSTPPEIPEPVNRNWGSVSFGVVGLAVAAAALLFAWVGWPGLERLDVETVPETIVERAPSGTETPQPVEKPDVATPKTTPEQVEQVAAAKVYWDFDGFGDDWDEPFDGLEDDFEVLEEGLSTL